MGCERCAATCRPSIAYNRPSAAAAARASRTLVRNTVVMIVLAILAAATWVATWQRQDADPPAAASADARAARVTTCAGRGCSARTSKAASIYRLFAERARRAARRSSGCDSRASASITSPRPKPHGCISASSASAPKDGSLLELVGSVEVRSSPADGSRPVTITTEKLQFPARHLEGRVGRARRHPYRRLATPRHRSAHGLEGATLCG